jgi:hypothetical protein
MFMKRSVDSSIAGLIGVVLCGGESRLKVFYFCIAVERAAMAIRLIQSVEEDA